MDLERILAGSDYAMQAIVDCQTGKTYGFELLMRCSAEGFSIPLFFDTAFKNGVLHKMDISLREKAVKKITGIPFFKDLVFFYNIDNRILLDAGYEPGKTDELLRNAGISSRNFCLEISEKHEIKKSNYQKLFTNYRNRSFSIALDDYGSGFSGLKSLYNFEPDFIKIDRFLISNIFYDPKKRLFVSSIVEMAHKMGIRVIAEGVQTELELFAAQECGCDFVQGYYIHKPSNDISGLKLNYRIEI